MASPAPGASLLRVLALSMAILGPAPLRAAAPPIYEPAFEFEEIARSGGATLWFEPPSINDHGSIAWQAVTGTALTQREIRVADGRAVRIVDSGRLSLLLQLNNPGNVVGQKIVTSPTFKSSIRSWSPTGSRIVAEAGLVIGVSPFPIEIIPGIIIEIPFETPRFLTYDVVYAPAQNNTGDIAFVGNGGPPGQLKTSLVFAADGGGQTLELLTLPGSNPQALRPMVSDDRKIFVRAGGLVTDPMNLYTVRQGHFTVETVAAPGSAFTGFGEAPGLSDDGAALAWRAKPPGRDETLILARLGASPPLTVFDPNPAQQNDGELTWTIKGATGAADRLSSRNDNRILRLQGSYLHERIPINRASANGDYRLAFSASYLSGTVAAPVTNSAIFTAVVGQDNEQPHLVIPPYPVLVQNRSLAALGTFASGSVADSVNSSNQLAVNWTSTGGAEGIGRLSLFVDPIRQNQRPWATNRYAPTRFAQYLAKVRADPEHEDVDDLPFLEKVDSLGLNTVSGKGCVLSSLSMAANFLHAGSQPLWNPGRLNAALDAANGYSASTHALRKTNGSLDLRGATGLPVFDGFDAVPGKFTNILDLTVTREAIHTGQTQASFLQGAWNYLVNSAERRAIMAVKSGHRFVLLGLTTPTERRVFLIDPYANFTPALKDFVYGAADFPAFRDRLAKVKQYSKIAKAPSPATAGPTLAATIAAPMPAATLDVAAPPGFEFAVRLPDGRVVGAPSLAAIPADDIDYAYYPTMPILDPELELSDAEVTEIEDRAPRELQIRGLPGGQVTFVVKAVQPGTARLTGVLSSDGSARAIEWISPRPLQSGETAEIGLADVLVPATNSIRLAAVLGPGSTFNLMVHGAVGRRIVLQSSVDLVVWRGLGERTLDASGTAVVGFPREPGPAIFYRAIAP